MYILRGISYAWRINLVFINLCLFFNQNDDNKIDNVKRC